jgi:hypothetical protein
VARKRSAKRQLHQVDKSHFPRFLMFQMLPFAGSLRKLATCKVEAAISSVVAVALCAVRTHCATSGDGICEYPAN